MTQINSTLAALLKEARMLTPSGGDTVAAQVAQAAMQRQQPQPQPSSPPGIEALMPGAKIQAARSAQEAQPATQGDLNQLRQRMAQAAPSQMESGVGGLGQDIQMAEGGVVGYAGPDGSLVTPRTYGHAPDYEDARRMGIDLSPYDAPEVRQQKLERLQKMRAFTASPERGVAIPTEASQANEQAIAEAFATPRMDQPQRTATPPASAPRPSAPRPPAPEKRKQPIANTGVAAAMLPDTRESTAVNPSESALQYAQLQGGIKELLERQSKPRERTPEELKEAAAREEDVNRRMGELDASKTRFEQSKQERLASQEGQGMRDLASFLSRARGRTGLAALGEAQVGMEPIFAARAAQEQQFRDQELTFMDKLGERRNLVKDLQLSSLQQDAARAREDMARLRALDMDIAKLGLGLGEKRMGELATTERSREEQAARLGQAREEMRSREKIARESVNARAAGAGALTPRDVARLRAQAEKDVDAQLGKDPRYVSMKVRDPAGAETYRTRIIDERLKRVLAEEGGGGAAPAPAAGPVYNFADIGKK